MNLRLRIDGWGWGGSEKGRSVGIHKHFVDFAKRTKRKFVLEPNPFEEMVCAFPEAI